MISAKHASLTRRQRNKSTTGTRRMHKHMIILLCLVSALCAVISVLSRVDTMDIMDMDDIVGGDDNAMGMDDFLGGNNIKNAMDMDGIVGGDNNGNDFTPTSPICTKKASYRPRPDDVSTAQYERVRQAEDVTFYIVEELNKIGVPVTIMYGSMLHEYRNGTSPCIQADFKDKDLDIAVFAQHFPHVLAMTGKIQEKFGWRVERVNEELMIVVLLPPNQREAQYGFQIDIYGFDCKYTNNKELIYFPWDKVAVNMNQFLPLVKHKTPVYNDRSAAVTGGRQPPTQDEERLYMHTPFNPPCLLANMYGADFMTPHEGKSKKDAHDESTQECMNQMLTSAQHEELQRQLSFCTW